MKKVLFVTCVLFCFMAVVCTSTFAQAKMPRVLEARRTTGTIKIDGVPNEEAWKDAAVMTDMVYFRPKPGAHEDYENRTVARLMYSNDGIYFGGFCYERTKDSIATELIGMRDGFGMNDYIGLILDTYNDKLNGFEYFVTPLGEQWDAKMNPPAVDTDTEDFSWNAVWKSGAVITDSGWSFEMFIPFSAIRFGKKEVQNWGLNVSRRRRKTEQQNTWNPIDPNVNGFLTQEGIWQGLSHIKPPVRLQFSPYFSVYANHFPLHNPAKSNWTSQVNGGMDVKFGINQAFTLDATLIPDFGQVQSDNQVLNLTPFEVKYNEYRNFFTEGTELFNKGNLFYSRRIGGSPLHLYDVQGNLDSASAIVENPLQSKLLNATKISGRTQGGLGIGILNAITHAQYATIEDYRTKERRQFQTDPLTNYNVIVLDQTLKYNSSISLINTNVWRDGPDYDANVTAGLFELNDKKNTYNLGGKLATSNRFGYLPNGKTETGFSHEIHVGKTSGQFNFRATQERTDTRFTSQDMGYFTNNNFLNHYLWTGYHWNVPKSWYNRINVNFNLNISTLAAKIASVDKRYQSAGFNINGHVQSKKLWYLGSFVAYNFPQNDFYEPRKSGWYFRRGPVVIVESWFESNNSKQYSFSLDGQVNRSINFYDGTTLNFSVYNNLRFNKKLTVSHMLSWVGRNNNMGYTYVNGSNAINFAKRQVNTVENVISAKYSFTNKMGFTFRARHYSSTVDNKSFYLLQKDGTLVPNNSFYPNTNQNVNFFNVDMVYSWQFAPGSFVNVVWKSATQYFSDEMQHSYFKNLRSTLGADNNNNLSLKVIYFLDYLSLQKHR